MCNLGLSIMAYANINCKFLGFFQIDETYSTSCIWTRAEHLFQFFTEKNSEDEITNELKSRRGTTTWGDEYNGF